MTMASIPSSTIGAHISYMALSVGYSYSIGKIFNYKQGACKNFGFQFTCALFAAEFYHSTNNGGTIIRKFKYPGGAYYNIDLPGLQLKSYGADAYFFFNNKKYSHAAAYCYSKIQKKSAGSLIAGVTLSRQSVGVDLSSAPKEIM